MAWTRACSVIELEDDKPFSAEVGDEIVALVQHEGQLFAIRDECSHGKVRLSEGDVDISNCAIECYLHGSMFDLRTGAAINLPATRPVPVYRCVIEGDQVLVDIDNPINNQEN